MIIYFMKWTETHYIGLSYDKERLYPTEKGARARIKQMKIYSPGGWNYSNIKLYEINSIPQRITI